MIESYRKFHLQLLAGEWREGRSEESHPVVNPYSGKSLTSIRSATSADLDTAYQKAVKAQEAWADTPPAERSAPMLRLVSIFDGRKEERKPCLSPAARRGGRYQPLELPAASLATFRGAGYCAG